MLGFQTQFSDMSLAPVSRLIMFIGGGEVGGGINPDAWAQATRLSRESGVLVIYRRHHEPPQLQPPKERAKDFAAQVVLDLTFLGKRGGRPARLVIQGENETGLWEQAGTYNEWTYWFAHYLHEMGGYSHAAYSFATGNPPGYRGLNPGESIEDWVEVALKPYWAHYIDGLRETMRLGGSYSRHEYLKEWSGVYVPWHVGRCELDWMAWPDDLKGCPIDITEFGADWQLQGGDTGYKDYLSDEQYAQLLHQCAEGYRSLRLKGVNVRSVAIFGAGMTDAWRSFNIAGRPILRAAIERINKEEKPMPMLAMDAWVEPQEPQGGSRATVVVKAMLDGKPKEGVAAWAIVHFPLQEQALVGNTGDDGITRLVFDMKDKAPLPIGTVVNITAGVVDGNADGIEKEISFRIGGKLVEFRDRWPELYTQWRAAGGVSDIDFMAWVAATQGYKPTSEEFELIASAVKGNVEALKQLAQSPKV